MGVFDWIDNNVKPLTWLDNNVKPVDWVQSANSTINTVLQPAVGFGKGALTNDWDLFNDSWMGDDYVAGSKDHALRSLSGQQTLGGGSATGSGSTSSGLTKLGDKQTGTVTGPGGYTVPGYGPQATGESDATKALRGFASGGGGGGAPSLGGLRSQLDAEFSTMLGRLDEMYALAETPEEQAMIEFALTDLQDQYANARASIDMVYDEVDASVAGYVDSAEQNAAGIGDEVRGVYAAGAERQLEQEAMARALLGEQFGDAYAASVSADPTAAFEAGVTSDAGMREGDFAQATADLSVEDAQWIQQQLGGQRGANLAEASRIQAGLRAAAIAQHQQQVNQRIAQERLARAAAEQAARQQRMQALQQIAMQEAQMRASAANAAAGRRLSALQSLAEQGGSGAVQFGDLSLNPQGGRVGPNGAWDAGTFSNAIQGFQGYVQGDPGAYHSERQRLLGDLLEMAPAPEGANLAVYESWLNQQFDAMAPQQYQLPASSGGGGAATTTKRYS